MVYKIDFLVINIVVVFFLFCIVDRYFNCRRKNGEIKIRVGVRILIYFFLGFINKYEK